MAIEQDVINLKQEIARLRLEMNQLQQVKKGLENTSMGWDGAHLRCKKITVDGDGLVITGPVSISGAIVVGGGADFGGNVTIAGTLAVAGDSLTVGSTLQVGAGTVTIQPQGGSEGGELELVDPAGGQRWVIDDNSNQLRFFRTDGGGQVAAVFEQTMACSFLRQLPWNDLTPALQNGWVAYAGGWRTPAYRKDSMGYVHLRGMVKNGTFANGTTVFTLPTGFRPSEAETFSAFDPNDSSSAYVQVTTGGDFQVVAYSGNGWVGMNGITFEAA